MQEATFAHASLAGDGVQRQGSDTIPAGNHRCRFNQLTVETDGIFFTMLGFHIHGRNHTDQTV